MSSTGGGSEVQTGARAVSNASLRALAASAAVPAYDRGRVTVGVVHLGVGGFHRAHQALYLDRLMEVTGELHWGICGVGVRPEDRAMRDALRAQDGLYTLVERRGDGTDRLRVVGSLVEYLFAPEDVDAVVERLAAEATRIVSLTITEGGYAPDPPVAGAPASAFDLLAEALRRRRDRGLGAFTVLSCDNLRANGALARERLAAVARRSDPGLAEWIVQAARFPSTMVDRITPATSDADRAELAAHHGIADRWPVVCEAFTQWVVEDDFAAGRPPLEAVGVQLVDDVEPYELLKLRLLNGSHLVLAHLAHLAGHRFVHEALQDPPLRALVRGYMDEEATPTLAPVPGIDVEAYKATLVDRFSDARLRDTVARLREHPADRFPAMLLPVVRHQLATGGEVWRCATAIAAWALSAEQRAPTEVVDALGDLADDERFAQSFRTALLALREHGARHTIDALASAAR